MARRGDGIYRRGRTAWLRLVITLSIVAVAPHQVSATTMVAYWNEAYLVIGADGLQTRKGRSPDGQALAPRLACKVLSAGNAIFGVGGVVPGTFDVVNEVADILSRRSTVQTAGDQISQVLTAKFNSWATHRGPDHIRDVVGRKKGDLVSEIVFGAFEGRSPDARLIAFELVSANPPRVAAVARWSCSARTPCASNNMVLIGEQSVIRKRLPEFARTSRSATDLVASLVQLEIDARSPEVDPPIAVAELTSTGISWPRKGACL